MAGRQLKQFSGDEGSHSPTKGRFRDMLSQGDGYAA